MMQWAKVFLLLLVCSTSFTQDRPAEPVLPQEVSGDWWSSVQRNITQSEYYISKVKRPLPEAGERLQAPNRKQSFRSWFMDGGFTIQPRDVEETAWTFGLKLIGYGPEGNMHRVHLSEPEAETNRVWYPHDEIVQWCENRSDGLEHGFTVNYPVAGDTLEVRLVITGDLRPSLADETTVELINAHGVRVLTYDKLVVTDAEGKRLSAAFRLEGMRLFIMTDIRGATFPIEIDPLASTPAWTAESDQASANFGFSVSAAGDVNGDGYGDVIVGAPYYDDGETDEGRAFVYLGSPSGLSTAPFWTAESDQAFAFFGYAASAAGDVNGDGYGDVIVGAYAYDNGELGEGRAFVYLGSAFGLSAAPSWTAESDQAAAGFGLAVSAAGDVNGDGYGDVIVGAPGFTNGASNEGRAFVYLGSASGLSAAPSWTAESGQAAANLGFSVSAAGDVNGDGYGDVIVGALVYDNGEPDEGRAFVYLGSPSGLSAAPSWTAESDQAFAYFGFSVSAAGDVNGDGYGDVIVGAPYFDNGETDEGRAFVYLGSASGLSAAPSWTAESDQASARFGYAVSAAGDVNGDGYGDVIVGVPYFDNGETDEGRAFVYLGSASGLSASPFWTAESDQADAYLGWSVSAAGDVNGDGYGELIVGAPYYDNGENDEGRAFVYLGSHSGLSAAPSWTSESDHADARFGYSVSAAGDVNGDGYGDVIVGAPYYDNGELYEGRAFVYLGSASGLSAAPSWTAESDHVDARFGYSVSAAGDVNGDGYGDVIVGAHGYDNYEGRAFVYLGSGSGLSAAPSWISEANMAQAYFGWSVSAAGDVNGDGYGDVIVGAPGFTNGEPAEGRTFVYLGSTSGLSADPSWTAESDQYNAWFGRSVSAAGDVNGDGYGDVIVGAPYYDNGEPEEGGAFVYLGSASGLSAASSWTAESDQDAATFGYSVSGAGDVNGDGYSDVIVGAPYYDNGEPDEGGAFVYLGSASGLSAAPAWIAESDQADAYLGYSVSTTGDVNGDGYSDVIVGVPYFDNGETDEGRAFVCLGSPSGPSAIPSWTAEPDYADARFGYSVSAAGDVNGDGYSDVIVGAYWYSNGEPNEGLAVAYYGNGSPGLSMTAGQFRTDGTTPVARNGITDEWNEITVRIRAHTPVGRTRVKLQWQVHELGIPFDAPGGPGQTINGQSSDWIDTVDGTDMISETIPGLSVNTPYHWRVRLLYHPVSSMCQTVSRWYSIQDMGWNDVDFRTANPGYTISGTVTDGTNPIPDVTITFSHDGGTAVTDGSGQYSYTVPYGTSTTLIPTHSGYVNWSPVVHVLSNITSDQPARDFRAMPVGADFVILATAGPNGSVSPHGTIPVNAGDDLSLQFTPDVGYHVGYLMVDEIALPPMSAYTFSDISANHTLHVHFAINQPPIITSFTADRESGNLPVTVTFTVTAHDPDGGTIIRYDWDLDGDGAVDQRTTTPELAYTYRVAGEYPVAVTVIDDEGEQAEATLQTETGEGPGNGLIIITDAAPLMLPVGLPAMLDILRGTDNTALTLWAVNPYGELVTGELNALDDAGTTLATEVFHIGGHGKLPLDLGPFSGLNYQDVSLTADHFFHLVVDARGDGFRFTCYQPLGTSVGLFVPHVAEAIDQWDTISFLSNQEKLGVDLTVHGSSSTLAPAYQLTTDLSSYLPETVDTASSWGGFEAVQDSPFTDPDTLTGFEAFLRKGSDGAALKLVNQPSTMLFVPHIPTNTAIFWSGFTFLNPSDSPVNATATLYNNSGEITGVYPFQVAAGTKVKGVFEDLFPGSEDKATWGVIETDGEGLIGLELFGTYQDGICGFPLSGETLESGIFPLTETGVGNWTGLAFANPNEVPVMLELMLVSFTGEVKAVHETEIAPMSRSAAVVGELFSLADLSEGDYLWFSASAPLSAVSVSGDDDRSWMSAIPAVK